jgi:hypothetical protein
MPSKQVYLYFFLGTTLVLVISELFVYFQLRRILRRDFPERAKKTVPVIRWTFILMNIPVIFLFFRRDIKADVPALTKILLYPFTVWQFLILLWTVILIPVTLIRIVRNKLHVTSHQ